MLLVELRGKTIQDSRCLTLALFYRRVGKDRTVEALNLATLLCLEVVLSLS